MTRVATVSSLKTGRLHNRTNPDGKPGQGTVLRDMYDALRRGEIVSAQRTAGKLLEQLRNNYGMELMSAGHRKGLKLVGEWEGSVFVPIERILQEDMVKA